ncbi:MAG: hypothetical protein HYW90_01085 [Candidatus Sungbacteria bacterium]|nr:hypothetical protein [Candidatus Sungbacteria bacterium]
MKSRLLVSVLLLSVVALAGCGTLVGGAIGAGVGAAIGGGHGAAIGAAIGGGAGAIYDFNRAANGQPVIWVPGGPQVVSQPVITVIPAPPLRRPVICMPPGRMSEEWTNMSDPNGGPGWFVKTGRVFCDYPNGRRVIVTQ